VERERVHVNKRSGGSNRSEFFKYRFKTTCSNVLNDSSAFGLGRFKHYTLQVESGRKSLDDLRACRRRWYGDASEGGPGPVVHKSDRQTHRFTVKHIERFKLSWSLKKMYASPPST
jgi:hypothetical protein